MLEAVFDEIRSAKLKEQTQLIRKCLKECDDERAKQLKVKLPAVIFAGKFITATNEGLRAHAGLLCVDFDNVNVHHLHLWKERLAKDPHTRAVFVSPRGKGLKWVVRVDANDANSHKACFASILAHVGDRYPDLATHTDKGGSDVSRKCFLCHDPEIIVSDPTESFRRKEDPTGPKYGVSACELGYQGTKDSRESSRSISLFSPTTHSPASDTIPAETRAIKKLSVQTDDPDLRAKIQSLVPTQAHATHDALFNLGRLCRSIEVAQGIPPNTLPPEDRNRVFDLWHELVPPKFLSKPKEDYRGEFLEAANDAKNPLDAPPLEWAWRESATLEPPPEAWRLFPDPGATAHRRLFTVAAILSKVREDGVFWISSAKIPCLARAEEIRGLDSPEKVRRILRAMEGFALWTVEKGSRVAGGKATTYKYILPIVPALPAVGVQPVCTPPSTPASSIT